MSLMKRLKNIGAPRDIVLFKSPLRAAVWHRSSLHGISKIFKVHSKLIGNFSDSLSRFATCKHHKVVMEIDKLEDLLDFQIGTEGLHCWSHQDDIVVEILVELLDAHSVHWLA